MLYYFSYTRMFAFELAHHILLKQNKIDCVLAHLILLIVDRIYIPECKQATLVNLAYMCQKLVRVDVICNRTIEGRL